MPTQRKTILVVHPSAQTPSEIRRLLGGMGHIAVTVAQWGAALKVLGTVRFDVVFTGLTGSAEGEARSFIEQVRMLAPGAAVVGIEPHGTSAANEPWQARCDATVAEPLSPSKLQWVLDYDLRYFGS